MSPLTTTRSLTTNGSPLRRGKLACALIFLSVPGAIFSSTMLWGQAINSTHLSDQVRATPDHKSVFNIPASTNPTKVILEPINPMAVFGRSSLNIQSALQPLSDKVVKHVVDLESEFERRSTGTLVSSEGLIVAKYSELGSEVFCRINETKIKLTLVANHPIHDLALIQIDKSLIKNLSPISFPKQQPIAFPGQLVVTVSNTIPAKLGVVSVSPRRMNDGVNRKLSTTIQSPASRMMHDRWGGGPFSEKRFGFDRVIVHDSLIEPEQCGGPLVDLQGNVLGINISRAMRSASFAIPISSVEKFIRSANKEAKLNYRD